MKTVYLSPSTINLYLKCRRCFWLKKNKNMNLPEPPTSTLPRGMDLIIKNYFDLCRQKKTLPEELKTKVRGRLLTDQKLLNKWRNWQTGLSFFDEKLKAKLFGALDECLVDKDFYIPVDYKTRGFALKDNTVNYYAMQLSLYCLLLDRNGYKTSSLSYLIFYIPNNIKESGTVNFSTEVMSIKTDINKAYQIFKESVECLRGPLPPFTQDCEYCSWYKKQEDLTRELNLF